MALTVDCLLYKREALSSNPTSTKTNKQTNKQTKDSIVSTAIHD
jgi:hypothetical protein